MTRNCMGCGRYVDDATYQLNEGFCHMHNWKLQLWLLICFEIMYQHYLNDARYIGLKGVPRDVWMKIGSSKANDYRLLLSQSFIENRDPQWLVDALKQASLLTTMRPS